tara:strand:+ start:413 stop:1651 length:1239 start_codon:yes stop_codon:yes gene_type:complete
VVLLDLEFVRSHFPAFTHPDSRQWAHLENAGGSYVPNQVISILQSFYTSSKVQPYWNFGPSAKAGQAMDRSAEVIPATFNASPVEVHFGPSTSQNTYVLANALRPDWDPGDNIVVTNQDHEANIGAWRRLKETGIEVREWRVNPETGLLDIGELAQLICSKTQLVAVTHASNLAATINPLRSIAELIHGVGGLLVADGVSFAPHAAIDVQELNCDIYLYSTYKTYGPHLGLMYTSENISHKVTNQGHFFNADKPTYRLTPAGPDHASVAACAGMVDYYEDVYHHHFQSGSANLRGRLEKVFQLFGEHEEKLMEPLIKYILSREDFRLIGTDSTNRAERAPTVAFHSYTKSSEAIYNSLIDAKVSCGHGNFYAHRLTEAVGLNPEDGVVRLSMVHYNTVEEVGRAIEVLQAIN